MKTKIILPPKPAGTKWRCGVLKDNSYISFSPDMHNKGYAKTGIKKDFVYAEYSIKPQDLDSFMKKVCDPKNFFRGLSVGKPFKGTDGILKKNKDNSYTYINEVDLSVRLIGAANTIIIDWKNGKPYLSATNTDYIGFTDAVKDSGATFKGKSVLIFGAGGAARASIYGALKERAGKITVVARETAGRNRKKLKDLQHDFSKQGLSIKVIDLAKLDPKTMADYDIIVSAMGSEPVVPVEGLLKRQILVEWAYSKGKSKSDLEAAASKKKDKSGKRVGPKRIVNGRSILVYQANGQFEAFTGVTAPTKVFKDAVAKATA